MATWTVSIILPLKRNKDYLKVGYIVLYRKKEVDSADRRVRMWPLVQD